VLATVGIGVIGVLAALGIAAVRKRRSREVSFRRAFVRAAVGPLVCLLAGLLGCLWAWSDMASAAALDEYAWGFLVGGLVFGAVAAVFVRWTQDRMQSVQR
jgi:hypothetical protein